MSHCLPSPPPKPAAPTFQIAASSKQTQLITGPSLAVGTPCFSRTAVILAIAHRFVRRQGRLARCQPCLSRTSSTEVPCHCLVGGTPAPQRERDATFGVELSCPAPVYVTQINALFGTASKYVAQATVFEPIVRDGINRLRFQSNQREFRRPTLLRGIWLCHGLPRILPRSRCPRSRDVREAGDGRIEWPWPQQRGQARRNIPDGRTAPRRGERWGLQGGPRHSRSRLRHGHILHQAQRDRKFALQCDSRSPCRQGKHLPRPKWGK